MNNLVATRIINIRWSRNTRPQIFATIASAMQGDREQYLEPGMKDCASKAHSRAHELIETLDNTLRLSDIA